MSKYSERLIGSRGLCLNYRIVMLLFNTGFTNYREITDNGSDGMKHHQ
jgi:hypothetical protein